MLVYSISLNGAEKYIGITSQRLLCKRWGEHMRDARENSDRPLYRAIRKYGCEAFEPKVIAHAFSKEDMKAIEQELIIDRRTHVTMGGYNVSWGGETGDHEHHPKGESHHQAVMTEEMVVFLRRADLAHIVTRELLEQLDVNVTLTSAGCARAGKSWQHLNKDFPPIRCGYGKRSSQRRGEQARENLKLAQASLKEIRIKRKVEA